MEQQPHHEAGLPADEPAIAAARAASSCEEQGQARAKFGSALSSIGRAGSVLDAEVASERSSRHAEASQPLLANVYADPERHTVALLLDDITANMVIYAVRVLAADSEAHAREVRRFGATLPPDSYGAANRHAVASRHERIALRLRALEYNYRDELTVGGKADGAFSVKV